MIGPALAGALKAGRERFNARFAEARRTYPTLDGDVVRRHLTVAVSPILEAVAAEPGVEPERVRAAAEGLYDLTLDVVGKGLIGADGARHPATLGVWTTLLPALARHVAREPKRVATALTNAAHNLATTAGARPDDFLGTMAEVSPYAAGVDELLRAGSVVAWRSGMAHLRPAALESAAALAPALAARSLGLSRDLTAQALASLVERLRADPWLDPRRPDAPRPLRLVARAGAFHGFGGPFAAPPTVSLWDGRFVVVDRNASWLLAADRFGATFHRLATAEGGAGDGPFRLSPSGEARWEGARPAETLALPELAGASSWVSTEATLAVTHPLSHHVFLVAKAA